MTNREKYSSIFRELFNGSDEELNESFTFAAVSNWDSMSHLTLISELEAAFDVMFETNDILHFGGYENGIAILTRYGVDMT